MAGAAPDIPQELAILAGEYVLGTLTEAEMRAVRRRAREDVALDAAIAAWEQRLMPLADLVADAAPPAALWERLDRAIDPAADAPRRDTRRPMPLSGIPAARPADGAPRLPPPRRGGRDRQPVVWPWQVTTLAALALAAGLAALTFVPAVAPWLHVVVPSPRFAALLPPDSHTPGFLAEARPDGSVMLTALAPVSVATGHALELWQLRPGASVPTSLGVLPPGGARVALTTAPPSGTQLMVSLEPAGGSPTGRPTGPVLYAGVLQAGAL